MRKLIFIIICSFVLSSCNTENGWDCIQTVGDIVEVSFDVEIFERITVEDDIFLEIEQGDTQQVIVTTGSNLLSDISVVVEEDGNLRLKNYNKCNYSREYDVTRIKVVTPTLTRIRSSSINTVSSLNTLFFESLILTSNTNVGVIDSGKSGDFILDVSLDRLVVQANGVSRFEITGTADKAQIEFLDDIPRFDGGNLIVQDLVVYHASSNIMTVNPQQSIKGSVRRTGDVISLNEPPLVEVEELYTGRLIFQ